MTDNPHKEGEREVETTSRHLKLIVRPGSGEAIDWDERELNDGEYVETYYPASHPAVLSPEEARLLMSDRMPLNAEDATKRDHLIYRLHALAKEAPHV